MRWPLEMRCKAMTDAGKLKGMKREEVQALAKGLGVNAGGKTEEIIARIQAAEAAQGTQEGQEGAAGQGAAAEAAQDAQGAAEKLVTVKITEKFFDLQLNQLKEKGEAYQVKKERAEELVAAGVAEVEK